MEHLLENYYTKINNLEFDKTRYLYDDISTNLHLYGIIGERGVGKTTLMLQIIKYKIKDDMETLN